MVELHTDELAIPKVRECFFVGTFLQYFTLLTEKKRLSQPESGVVVQKNVANLVKLCLG